MRVRNGSRLHTFRSLRCIACIWAPLFSNAFSPSAQPMVSDCDLAILLQLQISKLIANITHPALKQKLYATVQHNEENHSLIQWLMSACSVMRPDKSDILLNMSLWIIHGRFTKLHWGTGHEGSNLWLFLWKLRPCKIFIRNEGPHIATGTIPSVRHHVISNELPSGLGGHSITDHPVSGRLRGTFPHNSHIVIL